MASSFPSRPVYDQDSKQFTAVGLHFLRRYYANNPHPNRDALKELSKRMGCEFLKLQYAFQSMRNHDKQKQKERLILNDIAIAPQLSSAQSLPSETAELSTCIQFLNRISREQASDVIEKVKFRLKYQSYINPKHVDDEISPEEIGLFSSVTSNDGRVFKEWMSCLIDPANIEDTTLKYPCTRINLRSKSFAFLQPTLDDFLLNKNIKYIHLLNHHIALRAKLPVPLPALSAKAGGDTASHLCDTAGCIEPKHLEVESWATNLQRQCCSGVTLILRSQGESLPKKILQIQPCHHGVNHPKANGNYLTFSCRKIHVIVQSPASIEFFKNLP